MKPRIRNIITGVVLLVLVLCISEYFILTSFWDRNSEKDQGSTDTPQENQSDSTDLSVHTPKGMMILIEYTDMTGLSNFVNEMYKRNITGLIYSGPDFVEEHCEDFKKLLDYNVEIMASYTPDPLWDMSYEDQLAGLNDAKTRIEACTGQPVRILSSKYQASDENTAKVADELGVPYIVARGTTETEAFVYQPEEYDVKVLSVSNIPSIRFKYGSLCDYSYWVRGGSPDDMLLELEDSLENDKITMLSHTRIGGIKQNWLNMWTNFWDNNDIDWVNLDQLMTTDMTLPYWQIPQNHNNPYTPDTIKPQTELEDENNVENPCSVDELPSITNTTTQSINTSSTTTSSTTVSNTSTNSSESQNADVVFFSNGMGPMCLEAEEYFNENNIAYTKYLTTDPNSTTILDQYQSEVNYLSTGKSQNFSILPFIFVGDSAFSGFNDDIRIDIEQELDL